jgi:hypothetical protein
MANPTLFQLATTTVGSGGVSSVTFSSIPATYTDLLLKVSARTSRNTGSSDDLLSFSFGGGSVSSRVLDGGSPFGTPRSYTSGAILGNIDSSNDTANTFGSLEMYIPNYTSTNNKSYSVDAVSENNSGTGDYLLNTIFLAGVCTLTTAITSIVLAPGTGPNFVQYSTFTLYGVRNY